MAAPLVLLGFAALFASSASIRILQPTAVVLERLHIAAPPPPKAVPRSRAPRSSMPAPVPLVEGLWPPLPPLVTAPPFTAQDYLQERARDEAAALRDKVMGRDLQRNVGKPSEMPALRDNQGIPVAGGDRLVRDGDHCAQVHTVQGSPSPTNKIDVAEPGACPGGAHDASRDMGKALNDWAKKVRQSQAPPP